MNNFLCKIFLFLFFLFRFVNFINAQNWTVTNSGSVGSKKFVGIDKNRNVYSYFNSYPPVDFGDTICTEGRMYLVKYDSTGQRQWLSEIRAAWAAWGDLLVDSIGNTYISGIFSDTITIADTTLILYGNYYELFLAKFNTDGILQWARRSDAANDSTNYNEYVWDVHFSGFDSTGNIQLMLYYLNNLVVIGNDSLWGNGYDHALARIDTSGNFIWSKLISNGYADFKPMLIEPSGNFYLSGSDMINQNYIMKFDFTDSSQYYDATSSFLWLHAQEGEVVGFASDTSNNIYSVIRVNADTHFLKKYTSDGSLVWEKQINLKPGSFYAFVIENNGNVVIAGGNCPPNTNCLMPNYSLLYIEKYNTIGNWLGKIYLGIRTDTSLTSHTSAYDIIMDNTSNIYVTGDFFGDTMVSIIFIDDTIFFSSANYAGIFLTKFHSNQLDTTPLSIINVSFSDAALMLNVFPNPFTNKITLIVNGSAKEKLDISIINLLSQTVYTEKIQPFDASISFQPDLHFFPSGIYVLQVRTKNNFYNLKIIKQ